MIRTPIVLLAAAAALAAGAASAQTARKPARPAPEPVLVPASGEQIAAAALTHFGEHACEFGQRLHVALNPKHDGYVDVSFGKAVYTMKPLLSSTGALRLEDVRGRMLLLQIAFKSMLMDVEAGRRIADECVHDKQREARRLAESAPPQPGLGIDPTRSATAGN